MNQQPITILTNTPISLGTLAERVIGFVKARVHTLLYLVTRNPKFLPDAEIVETIASIRRGFSQLNIAYTINPWRKITSIVLVIASIEALQWALSQKKKGVIKTVIAGPGISVTPSDHDRLIADPRIDRVIVPTEEVKARWAEEDQYFNSKAVVWAAGAADAGVGRTPDGLCVVYSRNADEKLFRHIMETLWSHKVPIVVSNYGQFRSHEYLRLLKKAKFIIYLDNFSNQTLPLFDAWMAHVPSLVYGSETKRMPKECGSTFTDINDFESKLLQFQENYASFKPRPYALAHHTDSIAAGALRNIVEMK